MRTLDDVVLGFCPLWIARESTLLTQMAEILPPGEELMHVALMAGVEHHRIVR